MMGQDSMLTVEQAQTRVLKPFASLEVERIPILGAFNRVLGGDVAARMDIPPCANSAMDG